MKIAIQTPFEGFMNDIADVVRLFYGEGAAVTMLEEHDAELVHMHEMDGDTWIEGFALSMGEAVKTQSLRGQAYTCGGLEEKRQLKRLIKRCCYRLMKEHSGRQPLWGSLTGIRPTRLYYQQMENGNSQSTIFYLKAKAGWSDTQKIEVKADVNTHDIKSLSTADLLKMQLQMKADDDNEE